MPNALGALAGAVWLLLIASALASNKEATNTESLLMCDGLSPCGDSWVRSRDLDGMMASHVCIQ
jgi:hypothetical protein